ncbi:MAG: hypothetical protein K8R46_13530 [Pirellulales bacterium]|nr:hypothetical protein [Pirellulales bacterium]
MQKYPRSFFSCPPPQPQVGVPRRFDIGAMVVLASVLAVLFSILIILNVPTSSYVYIAIFIAGVATCQSLLFKGKDPRAASIIAGSVIFYLIMVYYCLTHDFGPRDFTKQMTFSVSGFFLDLVIGGFLGYLVGGLFAGGFMIRRKMCKTTHKSLPTDDGDLSQTEV